MTERGGMASGSSRVQANTSGSAQNQSSEGGLRNVRIDEQKTLKQPQKVSLLRLFRSEDKTSPGSPNTEPSQKSNSNSKSNSRSKSRVLRRRRAVASPVLSECKSMVRPGERSSPFKIITTNKLSPRTLSKPVFVGAPSPEREEEKEETEDEKAAVTKEVENEEEKREGEREPSTPQQGQETSSTWMLLNDFRVRKIALSQDQKFQKYPFFCIQSFGRRKNKRCESTPEVPPLGGVSTKTLISSMKKALNSPDGGDDDQDSASEGSTASISSEGDQRSQDIATVYVKEEVVKNEDKRGESYSSEDTSVNSLKRVSSSSDLDQDSQDSPVTQIKEEVVQNEDKRGESYSSEDTSVNSLKRVWSSSDLDQDSQDSPVTQIKVVKHAKLVASNDEEEETTNCEGKDDEGPNVKNEQVNGHNALEDSEALPDGNKFLEMWETVYTVVPKMEEESTCQPEDDTGDDDPPKDDTGKGE